MDNQAIKISQVNIKDIIYAEYNPRRLTKDQAKNLKDSLQRFGIVDPVILNSHPDRKNIMVGGHQRCRVWQEMGNTTIPAVYVNLSLDQEKELNVRLNKNVGEFDNEALAKYFSSEDLKSWGFTDDELEMFKPDEPTEAKEDGYVIPDEIETYIQTGDLIEIGQHRLMCASSTVSASWQSLMDGKIIDMIMTDPPYNVDYKGSNGKKIMNDKMSNNLFYEFLRDFFVSVAEFTKPGGSVYVWHADSEGLNFRQALIDGGFLLKQTLVWVKNALVMGRQDYQWKHEPCLYGWKEGAAHYFTDERHHTTVIEDKIDLTKLKKEEMLKMLQEITAESVKTTVIHCNKPTKNDVHPTMKPILLLAPLIANSSKQGQIVADGFLGSGSTMVACHQLNRICYGLELDPLYCQVIVERMRQLDPTINIKINGEELTGGV